jgi:hypothetical protein
MGFVILLIASLIYVGGVVGVLDPQIKLTDAFLWIIR